MKWRGRNLRFAQDGRRFAPDGRREPRSARDRGLKTDRVASLPTEDGIFAALRTEDGRPMTEDGVVISNQIQRSISQTVIARKERSERRGNLD